MPSGVVLDTSFLISLASPGRPNHQIARKYWKHFLESGIPIFLSAIVVSEFYLKQEIPPDLLCNCVILPFNWDAALTAADLDFSAFKGQAESRAALKDDLKIMAQAKVAGASYLITEDDHLFYIAATSRLQGKLSIRVLVLSKGFDIAFFNDGQREFGDGFGQQEAPPR